MQVEKPAPVTTAISQGQGDRSPDQGSGEREVGSLVLYFKSIWKVELMGSLLPETRNEGRKRRADGKC